MLTDIGRFIRWIRMRNPFARTWRDYGCDLKLFASTVGDRPAEEILPRDIDKFVSDQVHKSFKVTTINRHLAAVVSFYRFLLAEGRAVQCPVLPKRHYLREPQRLPRPIADQDLHKYLACVQDPRDLAMITLMLRCGLRIAEVSNLTLSDLFLGDSPSQMIIRGKGARERTIYLSPETERNLHAWLQQRPAIKDDHVFVSYQHKQLSTTSIHKRIRCVGKTSGVELTAHRFRHTFADHMLSAGMPITSIQKLMGHRFVDTTQNYVVANDHQVQADFYRAAQKLDGWTNSLARPATKISSFRTELDSKDVGSVESPTCSEPNALETAVPVGVAQLPSDLLRQLVSYRRLKVHRWRTERVAANSILFYSLHGSLWRFFIDFCDVKRVSDLRLEHVLAFVHARLDAGISAHAINVSLSSLRSFLAFLREDGVLVHRSLENIQRLKGEERLPRYMTAEQLLRLKEELDATVRHPKDRDQRDAVLMLRAVFYLLWQAGLRCGEVELLRVSDMHLSETQPLNRLFIRDGKWRQGRAAYLTDVTLESLQAYLAIRDEDAPGDFLFVRNGMRLKKNFLCRALAVIGRRVGVPVSPHRLRHTFATQLLNVGCPVTSIQKLLGHTNLSTTMTYARAFDQTVRRDYLDAIDTLEIQQDGAWFGLPKPASGE